MEMQNPKNVIHAGASSSLTGSLSEKRIRTYASRYFDIPIDDIHLQGLTPDASTRTYYRVASANNPAETFIISLYASPFNPHQAVWRP